MSRHNRPPSVQATRPQPAPAPVVAPANVVKSEAEFPVVETLGLASGGGQHYLLLLRSQEDRLLSVHPLLASEHRERVEIEWEGYAYGLFCQGDPIVPERLAALARACGPLPHLHDVRAVGIYKQGKDNWAGIELEALVDERRLSGVKLVAKGGKLYTWQELHSHACRELLVESASTHRRRAVRARRS